MPGPDRLISLFLEGLSNKSLHDANLYGQKPDTLNECIKDAIDLDDNCKLSGNVDKKGNSSTTSSDRSGKTKYSTPMEADTIADLVIKKMNQMFKPVVRAPEPPRFQKPYQCGICLETIQHLNVHSNCPTQWLSSNLSYGAILSKNRLSMRLRSVGIE